MKLVYKDLIQAYLDARRGKSNKSEIMVRNENLEDNMRQLYHDLSTDQYCISRPIRFIIQDPVVREIIALSFRDRIVQHLIHRYLYPILDPWFIYDSYSNRVGKGTHFGVRRVSRMMRSCSDCYTRDCYVLKMDIQSFFLSIDQHILRDLIQTKLNWVVVSRDKDWVLQLIRQIIFYSYQNCITVSDKILEVLLPHHKSLLYTNPGKWLPLGNLTSQLFANIYMNQLDQYLKHQLKYKYYGRYVDDFVIFHTSKEQLLEWKLMIQEFLWFELWLRLHPHKIYLQHYSHGVRFLWSMIYPHHTQVWPRTRFALTQLRHQMVNWGGHCPPTIGSEGSEVWELLPRVNSYLGLLKHHRSYHAKRKLCRSFANPYDSKIDFCYPYHKMTANPQPLPLKYQDEYWLYALI